MSATEVDENHGPSTNGSWMRCEGCRATVFCTVTRWLTTAWRMERGLDCCGPLARMRTVPRIVCSVRVGPPGAFTPPRNCVSATPVTRNGRLVRMSPLMVSTIQLKLESGGTNTSMSAFTA